MSKTEYHRIHMRSRDGDHVTAYLPLANGQFDRSGPQPFLMKAVWNGHDYYGELRPQAGTHHRIVWDSGPEALTDLGTAPIRRGAVLRIFESDTTRADFKEFVVHEVARV
jgi:hypothetical protein